MGEIQFELFFYLCKRCYYGNLLICDDTFRDISHLLKEHSPQYIEVLLSLISHEGYSKNTRRKRLHETGEYTKSPRSSFSTSKLTQRISYIKTNAVIEPLILLRHWRAWNEEDVWHWLLIIPIVIFYFESTFFYVLKECVHWMTVVLKLMLYVVVPSFIDTECFHQYCFSINWADLKPCSLKKCSNFLHLPLLFIIDSVFMIVVEFAYLVELILESPWYPSWTLLPASQIEVRFYF